MGKQKLVDPFINLQLELRLPKVQIIIFQITLNIINNNYSITMMRNLISKTKNLIVDLNDNLPFIGMPLAIGWNIFHRFKFIIEKKILELIGQLKYDINKLDFDKISYVNPQKIQYYLRDGFKKGDTYSRIKRGKWDQQKKSFEDLPVYQAFKQRFSEGKKWDEIKYFQNVQNDISNGMIRWGCKNKDEWAKKLSGVEDLYSKIKKNSSKLKNELSSSKELYEKLEISTILDDIIINIGRDGQLLLVDGEFGLSLAKAIDLPEIPTKIKVRHKKWMSFKEKLSYFSRHNMFYQKVTHIDLQDFPFKYGDERFFLIKENLSISKGTLLDIGTNLGYFCHKMEDEGFDCYGVEENLYYVYFLKKLRKAENKKFKIIPKSIFKYYQSREPVFDVVLALFIFHHFLKRKNTYLNLIKFLNRLKVKEMFFGAHNPRELQNIRGYINYTPDQFVNFILENSCLNKAELIWEMKSGRCIYKLSS